LLASCAAHTRQHFDILQGACAGLSWGIYFTAYNNAKIRWQGLRNESSLPAPLHLLSAAEAGCIVSPLTPFPDLYRSSGPLCNITVESIVISVHETDLGELSPDNRPLQYLTGPPGVCCAGVPAHKSHLGHQDSAAAAAGDQPAIFSSQGCSQSQCHAGESLQRVHACRRADSQGGGLCGFLQRPAAISAPGKEHLQHYTASRNGFRDCIWAP
jgi:hypothetical protein